jgi:hypothetical protein
VKSYLATQHDVDVLARGMRLMLRLGATQPFSDLLLPSDGRNPYLDDKLDKINDEEMEKVIRERVETLYVYVVLYDMMVLKYCISRYHPTILLEWHH